MSNSGDNLRLDCGSSAAGVPTLTTPTLTPTTLRNIEQIFLEASEGPPVLHQNAAHFVPPAIVLEHPSEPLPPLPGPTSVDMLNHPPLPGPSLLVPDVLVTDAADSNLEVPLAIKSEPEDLQTSSSGFNNTKSTNNNNVISSRNNDDERKRQLRRERNKEAAARCRKRRLDQIATLQLEVDKLASVKSEMQQELAQLESEREKLKGVLQVHACSIHKKKS